MDNKMADFNGYKKKLMSSFQKSQNDKQGNDDEKEPDIKKKITRHKVLMFYRILIVLIIIIVIVAIMYLRWINKTYTDYDIVASNAWTRTDNMVSMPLGNSIFSYSKDGMTCTDAKGTVLWNVTYEMQNPIVRTCGNVVAIGDYNGRNIYVCDTTKSLGQIDTTIPIRDFCVSSNGVIAAVLDDSNVTGIYLYDATDAKGKPLVYFKTTMSKSGYPLALSISDNSEMVAISYLQASEGTVSSNVAFYNFSAVGQNYTDNLVGGYGYSDAIVPYIAFMNSETSFAVADNRLMIYQGNQTPVNTADILIADEIQGVYHNSQYIGLVFYNPAGNTQYRLDIYDTNGKNVKSIPFDMDYTDIQLNNNNIIIYGESDCLIYNWKGILKFQGNFKENICGIVPTNSITKYTFITNESIETIELK